MLWKEIVEKSASYLSAKGLEDAEISAELLAARLLNVGRGFLVPLLGKEIDARRLEAMRRGLKRLIDGEPIQYVIGEWDFRHLTLKCDRRALIPRPETEELVSLVLDHLKLLKGDPVVVDVGTGTGAIILSIAQEFGRGTLVGTDISDDAIALAKENGERTKLSSKVNFVVMDGLDEFDEPESFDVIVSNPPYIESSVCETLDRKVRDFEPRLALDGGVSGLDFYERYLQDALHLLKPGGAVFFEIGENQGRAVADLMNDFGFSQIAIKKDIAGRDRFAVATLA